jgi:hypothetical protein
VTLRGPGNEMTRSNLIRGAKRFSAIITELREPEDASAARSATGSTERPEDSITVSAYSAASTWSNSIALIFGDEIAFASVVAFGGFAACATQTYLLGVPSLAFHRPDLVRQFLLLAAVTVATCGRVAMIGFKRHGAAELLGSGPLLACFRCRRTTASRQCSVRRYESDWRRPVALQELREYFNFAQKGYLS